MQDMNGLRKAAILLTLLGEDPASDILKRLDEEEVQLLLQEITKIREVTPLEAEDVLEEFYRLHLARSYVESGGVDFAYRLLLKAFGQEQAKRLIDRLKLTREVSSGFEQLGECDPHQLSGLLRNES